MFKKQAMLALILIVLFSSSVSAEWWDHDWNKRRALNLSIGTHNDEAFRGIDLNGLTITTTPVQELRIINEQDQEKAFTVIDYNQTWASIMLTVKTGEEDFYVYYDNPDAVIPPYYGEGGRYENTYVVNNHFDGNITDGTLNDDAYFIADTFGIGVSSIRFNDTKGWVDYHPSTVNPGPVTIDAWVYLTENDTVDYFFTKGTINSEEGSLRRLNNSIWMLNRYTGNFEQAFWNNIPPLEPNTWYHLAYTTNCIIHLNGIPYNFTSGTCGGFVGTTNVFSATQDNNNPDGNIIEQKWSGHYANFRVLHEIQTSFACLTGTPCSATVGDEEFGQILPDLEITQLEIFPDNPEVGKHVNANVTITNTGNAPADSFTWTYDFEYKTENSQDGGGLDPGESINLIFQHTYTTGGNKAFFIEVDPVDSVEELDEDNNIGIIEFFVDGQPDLVPFLLNAEVVDNNTLVEFTFSIANFGNIFATGVLWDLEFGDGSGTGGFIGENIQVGENVTFIVLNNYPTFNNYPYIFTADPHDTIDELNESNNVLRGTVHVNSNAHGGLCRTGFCP